MKVADFRKLKKGNKYNNQKTTYNGREYHSKKEAIRAFELDLLVKAKVVRSWKPQVPFEFTYNGIKICKYYADFVVKYVDGHTEVEDVKGVRTGTYMLKRKLMKAFYGIDIKEI